MFVNFSVLFCQIDTSGDNTNAIDSLSGVCSVI